MLSKLIYRCNRTLNKIPRGPLSLSPGTGNADSTVHMGKQTGKEKPNHHETEPEQPRDTITYDDASALMVFWPVTRYAGNDTDQQSAVDSG